jgi:hypothetical protein
MLTQRVVWAQGVARFGCILRIRSLVGAVAVGRQEAETLIKADPD